ncbi:MAG TPA: hypothetical protein PKI93_04890 [Alphaproteobacteria bacterium]|nr:hypothetical protein [Alphaproteobacteria bacterium]HNS44543.1 hypothetical protein [Alphaproteobacteria bacterium]
MSEVFEGRILASSISPIEEHMVGKTHNMVITLCPKDAPHGVERLSFCFNQSATSMLHLKILFEQEANVRIFGSPVHSSSACFPKGTLALSNVSVQSDISAALAARTGSTGPNYAIR